MEIRPSRAGITEARATAVQHEATRGRATVVLQTEAIRRRPQTEEVILHRLVIEAATAQPLLTDHAAVPPHTVVDHRPLALRLLPITEVVAGSREEELRAGDTLAVVVAVVQPAEEATPVVDTAVAIDNRFERYGQNKRRSSPERRFCVPKQHVPRLAGVLFLHTDNSDLRESLIEGWRT